jgi:hypothetical protein
MQPLKHKMIESFREYLKSGKITKAIAQHDETVLNRMADAKEYVLDAPFARDDMADLIAEANMMCKHHLLKLPFKHIVLQTKYALQGVLVVAAHETDDMDSFVIAVIARDPMDTNNGRDGWYATGMISVVENGKDLLDAIQHGFSEAESFAGLSQLDQARVRQSIVAANKEVNTFGVTQLISFLAFITFPRIRTDVTPRPDALNKQRRQKGRVDIDELRVVRVREHFRHSDGTKTKSSTHPSQPQRLHIVRGHIRNQAHGPKWSLHRAIWVRPYFAGDRSAGEVEVSHYTVANEKHGEL